jgi:hypothetical protein
VGGERVAFVARCPKHNRGPEIAHERHMRLPAFGCNNGIEDGSQFGIPP